MYVIITKKIFSETSLLFVLVTLICVEIYNVEIYRHVLSRYFRLEHCKNIKSAPTVLSLFDIRNGVSHVNGIFNVLDFDHILRSVEVWGGVVGGEETSQLFLRIL